MASTIIRIVRRRSGSEERLENGIYLADSLGMRVAQAALGDDGIADIVARECSGWSSGKVSSLTSGFSGAFLLEMAGKSASGEHFVIIKAARTASIIEREIGTVQAYLQRLGPLEPHLVLLDPNKEEFGDGGGVYYRQAKADGTSLSRSLRGRGRQVAEDVLAPIVDMCIEVARQGLDGGGTMEAAKAFVINDSDCDRLEASLDDVVSVGEGLRKRGQWPDGMVSAELLRERLLLTAKAWATDVCAEIMLPSCVQHGDLNPTNIMMSRDKFPRLIDLSRLGDWPIGYDLSRLCLLLRVHGLAGDDGENYFF